MTTEDPLVALETMFGKDWDIATLAEILKTNGNDLQTSIDEILAAETPEKWIAQRFPPEVVAARTQRPTPATTENDAVNPLVSAASTH